MEHSTPQAVSGVARLLANAALCVNVLACRASSISGGDGLTDAAGVSGQIVYVTNAFAGGQRLLDSLEIDSASGRWSQSQCGPVSATGAMCDQGDFRTARGTVEPFLRLPLFERARRSDFHALRRDYPGSGTVPPDVVMHLLHIVQNGRRQTISWESGAALPPAVDSFLCRLQLARGALIICRE